MFEAYKVGITIALTNHISHGLMLIGRDLNKTDAQALKLKSTLNDIKKLAFGSMVLGGAGAAGLKAVGAMVKPAEDYVHQLELAKSKLADLAPAKAQLEIARMTAAAWATSAKVMTTTPTENLKAIQELRMVLGDTQNAVKFLPQMMKIQAVLDSALHGEHGVASKDVAFTAAKALEIRGASGDPKAFERQADLIVKAVIASGGRFNPAMLLQAQKYAGIGGTGYSDEFMYGILPTLTQELGGSSTGTALTSLYRAVVGGRIDKKALGVWQKLGLIESVKGVTGETAMVQAKNAALYQKSPLEYMHYLSGELAKKGISDPQQQQAVFERLFSNRVAGRIANMLATQGPRLRKDFDLINQAGTSSEYDRLIKGDPVMARAAAAAQWESLKTVVGLEVVPIIIPAIVKFTESLRAMTAWARDNPATVKALTLSFAGLSAAMLFGGTVLGLTAAFKGLGLLLPPLAGMITMSLIPALGALSAALVPLAAIAYHKEIAGAIDAKAPGIGDFLLRARDGVSDLLAPPEWFTKGGGFSPPPAGRAISVNTSVNLDGRKVAQSVSKHQYGEMNRAPASGGDFDGRRSFTAPAFFAP